MSRTVSTTEAKNSLNALMSWIETNGEEVIIENHGKPRMALIPLEWLEEQKKLKEDARRREALEWMRQYEEKHAHDNDDLTEDEVMELAVQAVREVRAERALERKMKPDHQRVAS